MSVSEARPYTTLSAELDEAVEYRGMRSNTMYANTDQATANHEAVRCFGNVMRSPLHGEVLLADIKAPDQAVLDLENMAGLLVEQHVSVEIARGHMNLDVGCSILADRKADWLRA